MDDAELDSALAFFKALADRSRLRILGLLAERPLSVEELAAALELRTPTVSHHLAALKGLGLVSARAEGVTRWHALRLEALTALNRGLLDRKGVGELSRQVSGEPGGEDAWETKVLASFVDPAGRLASIPASRRKRLIVLRWLAGEFEEGRRYKEAEVNEILQRRHWDCATLRRELIGAGMMSRESGVYWRKSSEARD